MYIYYGHTRTTHHTHQRMHAYRRRYPLLIPSHHLHHDAQPVATVALSKSISTDFFLYFFPVNQKFFLFVNSSTQQQ